MKRFVLMPALLLMFSGMNMRAFAQSDQEISENSSFTDRIFIGGNLGLQFGDITVIDVSPLIGYRLTNRTSAGIGLTYQYYEFDYGAGLEAETSVYGGRLFARHNVTPQIFLHGEYEALNLEVYNPRTDLLEREWVPGLLLGGGYFAPIGRAAGFNVTALYNLTYDEGRSPYNSPLVIRVGVTLGFGR